MTTNNSHIDDNVYDGLPKTENSTSYSYTIVFKFKSQDFWEYGKTFDNLKDCIDEQRALEKTGNVRLSVILKLEVAVRGTYLFGI